MSQVELDNVRGFLESYPKATIKVVTTMYDFVCSFIKPVPTICDAEIMMSAKTHSFLKSKGIV